MQTTRIIAYATAFTALCMFLQGSSLHAYLEPFPALITNCRPYHLGKYPYVNSDKRINYTYLDVIYDRLSKPVLQAPIGTQTDAAMPLPDFLKSVPVGGADALKLTIPSKVFNRSTTETFVFRFIFDFPPLLHLTSKYNYRFHLATLNSSESPATVLANPSRTSIVESNQLLWITFPSAKTFGQGVLARISKHLGITDPLKIVQPGKIVTTGPHAKLKTAAYILDDCRGPSCSWLLRCQVDKTNTGAWEYVDCKEVVRLTMLVLLGLASTVAGLSELLRVAR